MSWSEWVELAAKVGVLPFVLSLVYLWHERQTAKSVISASKDNPNRPITFKTKGRFGRTYELTIGSPDSDDTDPEASPAAVETPTPVDTPADEARET